MAFFQVRRTQSADKLVDFFTTRTDRKNFEWIISISDQECIPQISAELLKNGGTNVSNRLSFWEIGNSIFLKTVKRLCSANDACCDKHFCVRFQFPFWIRVTFKYLKWSTTSIMVSYIYKNQNVFFFLFQKSLPSALSYLY